VRKKYRVDISDAAKADIRAIRELIAADNPQAADRWAAEVEHLMTRLETLPYSFEVIPEAADLGIKYRHKLFGSYRIIYRVEESRVAIVRLIHGARLLDPSMFFS
jgi:toxin ParE1/3/4